MANNEVKPQLIVDPAPPEQEVKVTFAEPRATHPGMYRQQQRKPGPQLWAVVFAVGGLYYLWTKVLGKSMPSFAQRGHRIGAKAKSSGGGSSNRQAEIQAARERQQQRLQTAARAREMVNQAKKQGGNNNDGVRARTNATSSGNNNKNGTLSTQKQQKLLKAQQQEKRKQKELEEKKKRQRQLYIKQKARKEKEEEKRRKDEELGPGWQYSENPNAAASAMNSMKDTQLALKKLREEIDTGKVSLKMTIENPLIPREGKHERLIRLAKEQKKLGEKEMEYELEMEKERIQNVVHEHEELHPLILESCPICMEDVHVDSYVDACTYFSCCGKWWCKKCGDKHEENGILASPGCPFCREPFPEDNVGLHHQRLLACVERGVKWAQYQVGCLYEAGQIGGSVDMKKAVQHFKLSAIQNHPPSLSKLSFLHKKGVPGLLERSPTKAREYAQKAADLGDVYAQINVALMCVGQKGNEFEIDFPTAVKYATLVNHYATDGVRATSNTLLGFMFLDGNGIDASVNLAAHYLGIAVKENCPIFKGSVEHHYACALVRQADELYCCTIPGFNVLPRAAFWSRKALAAGHQDAKRVLDNFESIEAGTCKGCKASQTSSEKKFLRCGRCRIYWYCSKECQRNAWNAGHKEDCKRVFC